MIRNHQDRKAIRFAVCGALAIALTGCAGASHLSRATARAPQSDTAHLDRDVHRAEETVSASPRDAAARLALGDAYLQAGRFQSAATTFEDAVSLGDARGGTALRLALARIGSGHGQEAVAVLDRHGSDIAASDLGLALALAGETRRGVNVLLDALRNGENGVKLRQNLAYAYALDGHWAEARAVAAQDIPANQINDRISQWAMTGRPEDFGKRIAILLGTPLRSDAGQPVELALADRPAAPLQPEMAAAQQPDSSIELPAVDAPREFAAAEPQPMMPDPQPITAEPQPAVAELRPVEVPFKPAAPISPDFAAAIRMVSNPVVQPVPPRLLAAKPTPRPMPVTVEPKVQGSGGHVVQLGSFSSADGARRATKVLRARHPELKDHEFRITPAVVGGRHFWRVAAVDFSRTAAIGMCSKVKARGGGCIAYSMDKPLPGAIPGRARTGPLMAQR